MEKQFQNGLILTTNSDVLLAQKNKDNVISSMICSFHNNINCGPEYIQLYAPVET